MNSQTAVTTREEFVTECFLAPRPCQKLHVYYLLTQPQTYLDALETLTTRGILPTVSQATKARILVALYVTKQHAAFDNFLSHCDVVEVAKACEALDRPRLIRQIEARLRVIESDHPHLPALKAEQEEDERENREERPRKRRKRKYDVLQRQLKELLAQEEDHHMSETCQVAHSNSAVKELLDSASMSGALSLKIRKWVKKFAPDLLEFIIMSGSMKVWTALADLAHFNPKDFSLPFFLTAAHGGPIPEGTFVYGMRRLMEAPQAELAQAFATLAEKHPQVYRSYTFLRTCPRFVENREIAALLARHIPLGTAIWYMEELCGTAGPTFDCDIPMPDTFADEQEQLRRALAASMGESIDESEPDLVVADILTERLKTELSWVEEETSKVATSFAKLVERILQAQRISQELAKAILPAAVRRLAALKETVTKCARKTAVFGDASESMQTAIESATIFAAMVSVCFGGELCFFSEQFIESPHPHPATVDQVLEITEKIRAKNCTNPAAAMMQYFDKEIVLKRIVLVTDEWENESCQGYSFADILRKYKDEISPEVEVLLVGVGEGSEEFRESLRRQNIGFKRVEIDERRPDLTKFDALLRQMSLLSAPEVASEAEEGNFAPMAMEEGDETEGFVVVE